MKTIVVLPAYNCAKTLKNTISDIPMEWVDEIVLVDDFSNDDTYEIAKGLGLKHIVRHHKNLGYGANQKTCYDYALSLNADIIIMFCENVADFMYEDSVFITSGIIDTREQDVLDAFEKYGFEVIDRHSEGGWVCFECKTKA